MRARSEVGESVLAARWLCSRMRGRFSKGALFYCTMSADQPGTPIPGTGRWHGVVCACKIVDHCATAGNAHEIGREALFRYGGARGTNYLQRQTVCFMPWV